MCRSRGELPIWNYEGKLRPRYYQRAYIGESKPRKGRQTRDNNENKAVGGRLGFLPVEWVEACVSWAGVRYDDAGQKSLIKDKFTIDPAINGDISRVTLGLNISPRDNFIIKFEYGKTEEEKLEIKNDFVGAQCTISF